jgi:translation elongation factor EF-1beta
VQRGLAQVIVRVVLTTKEETDVSALEEKLVAVDGVKRIDVRHLGVEDEA